jgi:hypothetical protein
MKVQLRALGVAALLVAILVIGIGATTPSSVKIRKLLQANVTDPVLPPFESFKLTWPQGWLTRTVAIVAATDLASANDIQAKLTATGLLGNITMFNASELTPGLEAVRTFDAVLVYSDRCFADPVELGDVLAAYVEAGGGVVASGMSFARADANATTDNTAATPIPACATIQGRFRGIENPSCTSTDGSCDLFSNGWLASVGTPFVSRVEIEGNFVAARKRHWIFNDVTSLAIGGFSVETVRQGCCPTCTTVADTCSFPCSSDDSIIATWPDGRVLISEWNTTTSGASTAIGRSIVFNIAPVSSDALGGSWNANGSSTPMLLANTLIYAAGGMPRCAGANSSFALLAPTSDTESEDVRIKVSQVMVDSCIDLWPINAHIPTLQDLRQYSAVMLWAPVINQSRALGDLVGAFVEVYVLGWSRVWLDI